jgi:quinoprotein glucose dehydrogenase
MAPKKTSLMVRCLAAILCVLGLTLGAGGLYLVLLGGSVYYLVTGLAMLVSGVLLWRLDRRGAWLYGLVLAWTLVWSLWEAGFDGWALVPRLVGPVVLGLLFLLPAVQRSLFGSLVRFKWIATGCAAIVASIALLAILSSRTDGDVAVAGSGVPSAASALGDSDWPVYGGDPGGQRYSPLADIGPQNVAKLKVAWTFHTGLMFDPRATLEVTPLKIGDSVYLCDGMNRIFALDPDTGRLKWKFDPKADSRGVPILTCRGVAYYRVPASTPGSECAERIYTATMDAKLWAVDALTGKPCSGFGARGVVDLRHGLSPLKNGYNLTTSAPTIVRGKVVFGNWVKDDATSNETAVVRAYDAVSGGFAWAWDIGRPGVTSEPGKNALYTVNTPNIWPPMSVDEALGLVYMPTGNGIPDFWGGNRSPEVDKYSSSIVAVDAGTGIPRWSFQTTHHDLWDYDVPAQPTLMDWPDGKGNVIPALVQPTKRAETFVLDRRTGRPIVPVREKPVPQGVVAGDRLSPTQPFSDLPSLAGPDLTEAMMWGVSPLDQLWCRIKFKQADYRGPMTPPGVRPFISYPGYGGGSNWGGVSVDPERMLLVMNINRFAMYGQLVPSAEAARSGSGVKLQGESGGAKPMPGIPFVGKIGPFMSPLGTPCQQPPYGVIGVVDLKTRALKWSRPLGAARDSGPLGLKSYLPLPLGTPNMGAAVVTRSGLFFIGATQERRIRAMSIETGRELWSASLPAGGHATPMTYRSNRSGRQFVVIASGGGPLMASGLSDTITAFVLPDGAQKSR